jgi:hypothetical protein
MMSEKILVSVKRGTTATVITQPGGEDGDAQWRLVVFPQGTSDPAYLGAFVEITSLRDSPFDGTLRISVVAQGAVLVSRVANKTFSQRDASWGFAHLVLVAELARFESVEVVAELKRVQPWFEAGAQELVSLDPAMYIAVRAVTTEHLARHKNKLDLISAFETVPEFMIRKALRVRQLCAAIGERMGRPAESVRLWTWAQRMNKTVRP